MINDINYRKMKNLKYSAVLFLIALTALPGCDVIGGIFNFGVGVGVFIVVAILVVILMISRRGRRGV